MVVGAVLAVVVGGERDDVEGAVLAETADAPAAATTFIHVTDAGPDGGGAGGGGAACKDSTSPRSRSIMRS